ncbi:hypothetical protein [Alkalibacillus almallahensis]|uniref:hypothetical protein n=1 Tax=Alkalibacillus almallahensis TaxID=1379154 RepID=UPI00141EFDA9|nr:hypothetical protein [Alkalibacillus almallahensis]NIK10816.1 acetyl/propionyl-CoA carboxylase alpha subunit [Alkalibacillus almallahensis]
MEIFSLILHGVSFIAIIYLYQRLRHIDESNSDPEKRIREIEDLFNSYLLELKDENRKLLEEMSKFERQSQASETKENSYNYNNVKTNNEASEATLYVNEEDNQQAEKSSSVQKTETTQPFDISGMIADKEDKVEISSQKTTDDSTPQQKAFQMYDQGYSVESIAKYLEMGYTEVELMIKFHYKMSH